MRIGIDFRLPVSGWSSGPARYTGSLVEAMVGLAPEIEYYLYVDRKEVGSVLNWTMGKANIEFRVVRAPDEHTWEHLALPLQVRRDALDVFHRPIDVGGFILPPNCRWVVTVHDLIPLIYPRLYFRNLIHKLYYLWKLRLTCRADAIITVSSWSKEEVVKRLQVPPSQVTAIPEDADTSIFRPIPAAQARLEVIKLLGCDPSPFIFAIGGVEPRKNIKRLLSAFIIVKHTNPELRLVVLDNNWRGRNLVDVISKMGLEKDVIRVSSLSDKDMAMLYNAACLFVFPSLCEGFGLPILEAMACGTPVITSNLTAMPEVAGEAAFFVDPLDEDAISQAIVHLFENEDMRDELARCGIQRARAFSWQRAASQTLELFEAVVKGSSPRESAMCV